MDLKEELLGLSQETENLKSQLATVRIRIGSLIQQELEKRKITWCTRCHKVVPVSAVEYLLEYDINEGCGDLLTPSYFNRICSSCNTPYNFNWNSQWSNAGGERCRQFYKVKKEPDGYYYEKNNKWWPLPSDYLRRLHITGELMSELIWQLCL
ncbi:MAG: hypothetical protein ACWGHO_02515 [Candidatus Moraniibacteriota bacterium]